MDPVIKAKKIHAMKSYKRSQFLYNLVLHSLTALTCCLLCSYPYWFPSICISTKHFFFISLPYIWTSFFNPKCLFIVVNVIVLFLVGESKLAGSNSSPAKEIYDEYVERSQRLRGVSSLQEKKEEKKLEMNLVCESAKDIENLEMNLVSESSKNVEHEEVKQEEGKEAKQEEEKEVIEKIEVAEEVDEEKEKDGEEEHGLPTEELNRRIEDFIARVNKQRWLEAKSLVCCKA